MMSQCNHDHGPGCSHDPVTDNLPSAPPDPATESLASALRVSFRLLTVIMVLVIIAFLMTGFAGVKSNEKAVKKIFGKIVGTAGEGATYAWPFPVGEIEIVQVQGKLRQIQISDFWMNDAMGNMQVSEGLRPGWDGALLTGDQVLLHMRLTCTYQILDPVAYLSNVSNVNETLRSVLCQAAIRSAACRTADALLRTDQEEFLSETRAVAGNMLKKMHTGIDILTLTMEPPAWPKRVQPAYLEYTQAINRTKGLRDEAVSDARSILNNTIGADFEKLVGVPWADGDEAANADPNKPYNLIGKYSAAREKLAAARQAGDTEKIKTYQADADALMGQISSVLKGSTSGKVRGIMSEAQSYQANVAERARQWVEIYEAALPGYRHTQTLTMERLWADTRDRILSSPTVLKLNVPMGKDATVIRINPQAEMLKKFDTSLLKLQQKEKDEEKAASPELPETSPKKQP